MQGVLNTTRKITTVFYNFKFICCAPEILRWQLDRKYVNSQSKVEETQQRYVLIQPLKIMEQKVAEATQSTVKLIWINESPMKMGYELGLESQTEAYQIGEKKQKELQPSKFPQRGKEIKFKKKKNSWEELYALVVLSALIWGMKVDCVLLSEIPWQ